ncbi:MAG TPA: transposase [Ideonella sp.]|uniref:transposase n=1 Tax=Ideonella sp. TaxID=1929293 RepID=UPI002E327C4C|nr:transposase [Ideonella sp.]HEX5682437.1 transposase [Ideonella sp.]
MARQARLTIPGHPHHLLIRGNNRQPVFVDDDDRKRLLRQLGDALCEHPVTLHAYVLMPDHLHLLATPADEGSLARLMQSLGRRYVASFNARHRRSGTLWEGRYRAHVVGGADNVLRCMRFIELNPQRSGLASGLHEGGWSSLAHHLGALRDPLITEPVAYWQLGNTPFDREAAYRHWLEQGVGALEAQRIVSSLVGGRPFGDAAFVADLEKLTSRSLVARPRGRPPKSAHETVPNK